jgi:superfamily II DNA/RNA helicase
VSDRSPRPTPSIFRRKIKNQAAKSRLRDAGITHLTPVQERTLRAIIVDRLDVLVQAPTGSGKTLAYLLPLAHALEANDANDSTGDEARFRGPGFPSAIVFLPTRELAAQVFEHAEKHVTAGGFKCVLCCGGADEKPQISGIKNGARVVVGTPGRIKAFVDRGVVKTDGVVFQVLDECDRLLDGGFERDVEEVCRPPGGKTRTACFSATMPPGLVRFLAKRLPPDHATVTLRNARGGNVGGGVEHLAFVVPAENKLGAVVDAVDAYADGASSLSVDPRGDTRNTQNKVTGQTIVFVETKAHAERLAGTLAAAYEVRVVSLSWGGFFFFLVSEPARARRVAVDDDLSSSRPYRGGHDL